MAFWLNCPFCGPRHVSEFTFGSEDKQPPGPEADLTAWRQYIYFNRNAAGPQEEWWRHASGCGAWFKIVRDTTTNQVVEGRLEDQAL